MRKIKGLKALLSHFEEFFVAPLCLLKGCGQRRFKALPLCKTCYKSLDRISKKRSETEEAAEEGEYFKEIMSLYRVDKNLTEILHLFKYHHNKRCGVFLTQIIRFEPELIQLIKEYDYIVPVPIHSLRYKERGYNQALIIAKELQNYIAIEILRGLKRIKYTGTQTRLGGRKRQDNISGAFIFKPDLKQSQAQNIIGKKILIVDDVYTTGATVKECCIELKKAGAGEIGVFTLGQARAPSPERDYQIAMEISMGFVV